MNGLIRIDVEEIRPNKMIRHSAEHLKRDRYEEESEYGRSSWGKMKKMPGEERIE